jgi:hypothetical protein
MRSYEIGPIRQPTRVQVKYEVKAGNCQRQEMKRLTEMLYAEPFEYLEMLSRGSQKSNARVSV